MVVKKASGKGRKESIPQKSTKDDKSRRKSSTEKKTKERRASRQASRHSHHDQREKFEALEQNDNGFKGQLEVPKHHHHKNKSQLEIPGAEVSRSGSSHKKSQLEIPGAELSRSGSHHSTRSHHSHHSARSHHSHHSARSHVNPDEEKEGHHRHHRPQVEEDNTEGKPRRKSIHMDYTPGHPAGRRNSKHYKVDTDEETRRHGAKRNSVDQSHVGDKHRRKSSTETEDKHQRRKSIAEEDEKRPRQKSIVGEEEKRPRRKSIVGEDEKRPRRKSNQDDEKRPRRKSNQDDEKRPRRKSNQDDEKRPRRKSNQDDEKRPRRKSVAQDDEKRSRRKSIVEDDEQLRAKSVPKDSGKHHRRKSIQDGEKYNTGKSISQDDEKYKKRNSLPQEDDKHNRKKSIGQDDEKHRRKSNDDDGHHRRKSIGHADEKHSHWHPHGPAQVKVNEPYHYNQGKEEHRRDSIKEKVTFSDLPPKLPHGHGQPPPDIKVIALLAEGTQTHPLPKHKRHNSNNEYVDEELLAPYWETELGRGRDHLKQHQEAYIKAHTALIKTALRPSKDEMRDEEEWNRSDATLFPGELPEGVSPGLVYLNHIDRIFFEHHVEIIDGVAVCFDKKKNVYEIINGSGHRLFRMEEEKSRKCCGLCSGLELSFVDSEDQEVIRMIKKVKLTKCRAKFEMYSPPGHFIGSIEQAWNFRNPEFRIKDFEGTVIMIIRFAGTLCCGFGRSKEMAFMVTTTRGNPRGRIAGDWPDLKRTTFSTEDAYGVHFPGEINVIWKTLIVGGAFMVYQKYYNGLKKLVHHRVGHQARALVDFEIEPSRRSSQSTVLI